VECSVSRRVAFKVDEKLLTARNKTPEPAIQKGGQFNAQNHQRVWND
jgi:hypothetical protein